MREAKRSADEAVELAPGLADGYWAQGLVAARGRDLDLAKASLAKGGKVLLLAKPDAPSPELALSRTPIFWNRLMNPNRTWMLGLMVDAKVKRSWWFNLADVAAHMNDEDQRRKALDEVLVADGGDEVSRRALDVQRAGRP